MVYIEIHAENPKLQTSTCIQSWGSTHPLRLGSRLLAEAPISSLVELAVTMTHFPVRSEYPHPKMIVQRVAC